MVVNINQCKFYRKFVRPECQQVLVMNCLSEVVIEYVFLLCILLGKVRSLHWCSLNKVIKLIDNKCMRTDAYNYEWIIIMLWFIQFSISFYNIKTAYITLHLSATSIFNYGYQQSNAFVNQISYQNSICLLFQKTGIILGFQCLI